MKPHIVRQLRMERRDQNVFPFSRDDPPVYLSHNLHPGPHILEERRPYEHPHERLFKALYLELLLEGVDLPPEPVSFDERVHQAQQGLPRPRRRRRREDHPRARPPHGPAFVKKAAHPVEEARVHHQVPDSRGLAARHDKAGEARQVLRAPYLNGLDPEPLQDLDVLPDVPLEREHPDPRRTLRLEVRLSGRYLACLAVTSHASPAFPPLRDLPSPCRPSPRPGPCSPRRWPLRP